MTGPSYDRPTYPGIIPYRTNSPSSQAPAILTDGPRLLSVAKRTTSMSTTDIYKDSYNTLPAIMSEHDNQLHMHNGKRTSMAAITTTSLYATGKRNGSKESLKKVYTEKDLRASLQNYTLTEDEVRDKYYAYWEQQRVRIFLKIVNTFSRCVFTVLHKNIQRFDDSKYVH